MKVVLNSEKIHTTPILGNPGLNLAAATFLPGAELLSSRLSASRLIGPEGHAFNGNPVLLLKDLISSSNLQNRLVEDPRDLQRKPLNAFFDLLDSFPPNAMNLSYLDEYSSKNPDASANLRILLLNIRPEIVNEHFGRDALTWISSYLGERFCDHKKIHAVMKNWDINLDLLSKAITGTTHWLHESHQTRSQTVIANYLLLRHCSRDMLLSDFPVDIPTLLSNPKYHLTDPASPNGVFSLNKIPYYALRSVTPDGTRDFGECNKFPSIQTKDAAGEIITLQRRCFLDAPIGLVLTWKEQPAAVIAGIASDPETFFILQVHGLQGRKIASNGTEIGRVKSRGLVGLDWQVLLLDIARMASSSWGFSKVGLLGASNNQWLGSTMNQRRRFLFEHATNNYNEAAERADGWEFNNLDKNYYCCH